MIQIIRLKGKDKHLYRLLAPMVMDPEVIRANNNYPFKTGEEYVWFIAIEDKEVVGFVPVEQKSRKKAVINNYYVKAEDAGREEILSHLLPPLLRNSGLRVGCSIRSHWYKIKKHLKSLNLYRWTRNGHGM